ncbi:carbonic anhydrase family protein [Aquimarina longa]|uniref:carbonic anhydrase family protein n=1 Tax=Aquimarina longa TaxID=1080221 RepID=UPI000784EFA1|nr:carbonic anhydrase family protein [Aquimarina longa]
MITQTKNTQDKLTPEDAHQILVEGNERFLKNMKTQRDLQEQVKQTSKGQYPFAVILSCIDSRVPVELIFDLGIGDIFSTRVAGNIINTDILGSMEYSCKVAGSRIIVVMGHTKCGAVKAACENVELGNITSLLSKIKPAMDIIKSEGIDINDSATKEIVAIKNVHVSIERIRQESIILSHMEKVGEIKIIGSIYDVSTGKVDFFESPILSKINNNLLNEEFPSIV